ncbi:uncharacterized protein LOC111888674 isoform X2 [Lactuca sativa]|uniref:Las1-like family protein n=1 Tax=Lactuca sativa TaxID=4236 RepID=A0A9R1WBH5_LACSA|nr:uncharacterized protein LOC111888674 isoform X2 [Lactuca sativa]KAJ0220873.1 hypothetical protein LSAT_V11C200062060 [Lactuca sativa]
MESQLELGFKEATSSEIFGEGNYKLVPWISWDDWSFVRESLFSSSPASIDLALRRISAWRSRGCLPIIIEVTASIVEIQQKDSYFRDGLPESDLLADDMLTMLYCMTMIRLVNGIVEKTRKKNEVSIGEAADVIGIPRMLIDIRHECSHRDLPSLRLVRLASTKALDWLKAYYWEPQKMAIPYPNDRNTNFGKEIKSKIRELAFCLDVKQATKSSSPVVKGKRSKKHITKALKNVIKLYSSFPSEVVSILLEFLLKALESADVALDDWKPLIMKLSNKVPEMLLSLLKANLQMIETQDALTHDSGENLKPDNKSRFHETENLSRLFSWLIGNLKDLNHSLRKLTFLETSGTSKDKSLPKSALMDLLRKCLLVPSLGNTHLTTATSILAQTTANNTLIEKLKKLASLHTSNTGITYSDSGRFYDQEEESIREAANKFELIKRKLSRKNELKIGENGKKGGRWNVVKSWRPCPIGMLPSDFGSSGVVPVLEIVGGCEEQRVLVEWNEKGGEGEGKREADCSVGDLDDSVVKKVKMSEEEDDDGVGVLGGVENRLMIGGVWKRVTHDEVVNIASSVRILV